MKRLGTILWVIAVIFTTFLGFNLRYTNDQNNQSVILINDFDEVLFLEENLKKSSIDILKEQKKIGIGYTLISKDRLHENANILNEANFSPILKLKNGDMEEYESLIKKFNIKYLFFEGQKILGYPDNIEKMADIIKNNKLIFVVEEKLSQIGIQDKKGLNDLIEKTDYAINRMFKLSKTQIESTNARDLFYKLTRSVVDRNIRFVYIEQVKNPSFSISENYKETNKGVENFASFIKKMNYKLNGDMIKLNNQKLTLEYYFCVTLGLAITCVVYLKRLFNLDKRWSFISYFGMVIFIMFISTFGNIEVMLALTSSVVYTSLASLLVLKKCIASENKVLLKSIATFFGINLLGGYTVVSCLSSLNYTMNLDMFRGELAFLLPLVIYSISYMVLCNIKFNDIIVYIKKKRKLAVILTLIGVGFIIVVYILRSGNFRFLKATVVELRMREFLEYIFGVRPRIKEFLIGYPAIVILVHYRKVENKIFRFVLGLCITIGGISIVNSFCHVFTAISISIVRSVNGLILGMIIGKCILYIINSMSFRIFLQNNKLVKKMISLYNEKV